MKTKHSATLLVCFLVGALAPVGGPSSRVLAQTDHADALRANDHQSTPADRPQSSDFVKTVREATERFRDVSAAEREFYGLMFGGVSGPDWGAMGMHYVNMGLVADGVLDPMEPEIVIYEPQPNGRLRLIGADYLVLADAWHEKNPNAGTPEIGGQLLHYFESPNRFGLPPFYTLHVWAWKDNPTGMFVNWHSNVSCEAFSGK
jgi:hypothetical protein